MTIRVYGNPITQGSKRPIGRGVGIESPKLKPWREAVAWAAIEQSNGRRPIRGPVAVEMTFTLRKPKKLPKGRKHPDVKPDLDKLCRAIGDALTAAGVIEDDSRIVRLAATKTYPDEDAFALDRPGALIRIAAI